jgi:hypothetical protein
MALPNLIKLGGSSDWTEVRDDIFYNATENLIHVCRDDTCNMMIRKNRYNMCPISNKISIRFIVTNTEVDEDSPKEKERPAIKRQKQLDPFNLNHEQEYELNIREAFQTLFRGMKHDVIDKLVTEGKVKTDTDVIEKWITYLSFKKREVNHWVRQIMIAYRECDPRNITASKFTLCILKMMTSEGGYKNANGEVVIPYVPKIRYAFPPQKNIPVLGFTHNDITKGIPIIKKIFDRIRIEHIQEKNTQDGTTKSAQVECTPKKSTQDGGTKRHREM